MSVEEKSQHTHHHHHHHHHHKDEASRFKHDALLSMQLRKLFTKWLFRSLWAIAIVLMIAVIVVYTL